MRVFKPLCVHISLEGDTSCGQLLIGRSSYSRQIDGLVPWVLGGEVGKKGESPWQVGEGTKCHLRSLSGGG